MAIQATLCYMFGILVLYAGAGLACWALGERDSKAER